MATWMQANAQPLYTPYVFTNFAGLPGAAGADNGTGSAARFNYPWGIAVDGATNVYVADEGNFTIRKITPLGAVTTLAGSAGELGTNDGPAISEALFGGYLSDTFGIDTSEAGGPLGIAVDSTGNVYVADTYNYTIRKITPGGTVTTLAGSPRQPGTNNGPANVALFGDRDHACGAFGFPCSHIGPFGIAVDGAGNVYVADTGNHTIRKITPGGAVSTLAGSPNNPGSNDGTGSTAQFRFPQGVAVDGAGNVYVADTGNHMIRKITPGGAVTSFGGAPGVSGSADGIVYMARFSSPRGVAVDSATNIYVADTGNSTIRKVSPGGVVTTLAGRPSTFGDTDGLGPAALFRSPSGLGVVGATHLFVADSENDRITRGVPDPRLQFDTTSQVISNDFFLARLFGPAGSNVVVVASATLSVKLKDWTPLQTKALPLGGLDLGVPLGTNRYRFFSAHLSP